MNETSRRRLSPDVRIAISIFALATCVFPLPVEAVIADTTPPALRVGPSFAGPVADFNPACSPVIWYLSADDDGGISHFTWVTDRGDSGMAPGSGTIPNFSLEMPAFALQAGATTFTVTAYDLAGNTASVSMTALFTPPDTVPASWTAPAATGRTLLASPGDVNGDGYDDLLYGNRSTGAADLFLGSAAGLMTSVPWSFTPSTSLEIAPAGDVNRDGYDDLVLGAPSLGPGTATPLIGHASVYLGGAMGLSVNPIWTVEGVPTGGARRFGSAVATAGDIDGDGYDDLLVSNDHVTSIVGRVYLYRGSSTGPESVPSWSVEVPDGEPFASGAAVGDLNGDGYGDVAVPAYPGEVRIYLGSAGGLQASPVMTYYPYVDPAYGLGAEPAGDVNGDGFGDLLISCSACHTRAYQSGTSQVYYGLASGPSLQPAWAASGSYMVAEFGAPINAAGDVDADGFDDVLVAEQATKCDGTGRVHLYRGSAEGLSAHPDLSWTERPHAPISAGDVNGDGATDLVLDTRLYYGVAIDGDGDGVSPDRDCDDADADVHPGAVELPGNASDENCDGARLCDPGAAWKNHGGFVGCVARECARLVGGGKVTRATCDALVSGAARER